MTRLSKPGAAPKARNLIYLFAGVLFSVCTVQLFSEDSETAYTEDGAGVLLHRDGSWEYSGRVGFFDVERAGITEISEISIAKLLPCEVVEVTDGDTLRVVFEDPPPGIQREESIRLLGIGTPELGTSIKAEPLAAEARDFVATLVAESTVYLAFESKWRGSFGRLLAYVFTVEGLLINTELLSRGLASVYIQTPSHFHQDFIAIEVTARLETRGMWTTAMGDIVIRQIFNDGQTEYVELWNRTDQTIDLSGWYLLDLQRNRIDLPHDTSIQANERLQVLSGSGTTATGSSFVRTTNASIWNNSGDTAHLYNDEGDLVAEFAY